MMGMLRNIFGRDDRVTVRKSGDLMAGRIVRVLEPGRLPGTGTIQKGADIVAFPEPPKKRELKADANSTVFGEVLLARMGDGGSGFNDLIRATARGELRKVAKSSRPQVIKKSDKGVQFAARQAERSQERAAIDTTAEIVNAAVREATAGIMAKVNEAISGISQVQKAEKTTPTRDEIVQSRRNELAEIDAEILMGTSGLLETALPETTRISKADVEHDLVRWREQMGIQEHVRKPPYEGAR